MVCFFVIAIICHTTLCQNHLPCKQNDHLKMAVWLEIKFTDYTIGTWYVYRFRLLAKIETKQDTGAWVYFLLWSHRATDDWDGILLQYHLLQSVSWSIVEKWFLTACAMGIPLLSPWLIFFSASSRQLFNIATSWNVCRLMFPDGTDENKMLYIYIVPVEIWIFYRHYWKSIDTFASICSYDVPNLRNIINSWPVTGLFSFLVLVL